MGEYSCLRCKICFCQEHIKRKGFKVDKNKEPPCPKCGFETSHTKDLSVSTRSHKFGRQGGQNYDDDDDDYEPGAGSSYAQATYSYDETEEYSENDSDENSDDSDDSESAESTDDEEEPEKK